MWNVKSHFLTYVLTQSHAWTYETLQKAECSSITLSLPQRKTNWYQSWIMRLKINNSCFTVLRSNYSIRPEDAHIPVNSSVNITALRVWWMGQMSGAGIQPIVSEADASSLGAELRAGSTQDDTTHAPTMHRRTLTWMTSKSGSKLWITARETELNSDS